MVLGVRILQPPLNINGYENWYIGLVAIWCADWVKSSSRVLNCAGSNPVPFTNFNIIDMRNFLVLFIFAVLLSSCVDKTIDCTVYSVEKIQETSGDSERGVHIGLCQLIKERTPSNLLECGHIHKQPECLRQIVLIL